jgi:carbon-monoxide dehydrogenase large subunit
VAAASGAATHEVTDRVTDRVTSRYDPLLRGSARYAGDLPVADPARLVFVRAPIAHAAIDRIDSTDAKSRPGVLGVFTADDLDLVPVWEIHLIPELFAQPPLARDVVRYVGERVVAVVANTLAAAVDAAEAVVVEYSALPVLMDPTESVRDGAPIVFPEHGSNVALDWALDPDPSSRPDSQLDGEPDGATTVGGTVSMPRLATAPMEGLSILAVPASDGSLTLHVSTQSPSGTRVQTARSLGLELEQVRVITPRVGGGFGGKALGGVVDYVVAAAIARRLRRPVRFVEERADNLVTMHGRGVDLRYTVRVDARGLLLHIEIDELCDSGAYPSTNAVEPGKSLMMMCGPYRVPSVRFRGRSVVTNRAPSGAYRGPGRSEVTAVLERAMDQIARALDLDPVEVRHRNLLRAEDLPLTTVSGASYAEGDPLGLLDTVIETGLYAEWREAQRERAASGARQLLGVGIATVIDSTAWFSRTETVDVHLLTDGRFRVHAGTTSAGQEHATTFAAIVARLLHVPLERVEVVEGDTAMANGPGTSGSRSIQVAGAAVHGATIELREAARRRAAELLEASVDDIVLDEAGFAVQGVPARRIQWGDIAGMDAGMDASCTYDQPHPTHPLGVHLSLVEVDLDTGAVRPLRHVAFTDCGVVMDPPSAEGQVIGASAQGIGQVLYECVHYDADGTPLATSLAEYLMASAADLPCIEAVFVPSVSAANPLGAKGVGEIGMVAAPSAVWNAVIDALAPLGVAHVDLPCTPERVWRAIREAVG